MEKRTEPDFVLSRYSQALGGSIDLDKKNLAKDLRDLAIRHFRKYSFHTLHFNILGGEIRLARNYLIEKLMQTGGGSCFHHNALFQAILERNGIGSWFVSCLVYNPQNPEETFDTPSHIAIVFHHEEKWYLFDPGWNGTVFSIYTLPLSTDTPTQDERFQVRKLDNEAFQAFPYILEERSCDATLVPKYRFNVLSTSLYTFADAVTYLQSERYAFHTLFIYTRISKNDEIIMLVNRRLTIKTLSGEELFSDELAEGTSPQEKITELFGPDETYIEFISQRDFKNPDLGKLICPTPIPTLSIEPA